MNFRENFKKDMKKCDHHIADLRKQLASRYASVEKVRGQGTSLVNSWGLEGQKPDVGVTAETFVLVCWSGGGKPRNTRLSMWQAGVATPGHLDDSPKGD